MKKEEIPQDNGALGRIAKEVTYVVDEEGNYVTGQSTGWSVKSDALDSAWQHVNERIEAATQQVQRGTASPILYFMEARMMDMNILASYTGFWKWRIKKHLTPAGFNRLTDAAIEKYARLFEVTTEELKHPFKK